MIPDIINEIAEKTVKGMRDFVEQGLAKCGYSKDYVRRHIYDFITVNLTGVVKSGGYVSYVVYVPDEEILFGVWREATFTGTHNEHVTIHYMNLDPDSVYAFGEDAAAEVKKCARDAKQRAEEMLNTPQDAPESRTEGA